MNFFKNNSKERTPQEQITRFFVAVSVLAIMFLVVVISNRNSNKRKELISADTVERTLDAMLDTMFNATFGDTCTVLSKGPYQMMVDETNYDFDLEMLRDFKQVVSDLQMKQRIQQRIDSLTVLNRQGHTEAYYIRKIIGGTRNGGQFRCFQKADTLLQHSYLTNSIRMTQKDTLTLQGLQEMLEVMQEELDKQSNTK